jgi:hypothetical protein
MAYGDARVPARERNAAGPPCENRLGLLLPLVAALFGLALAAYIVLSLPAWAALCIALGAVLLVMIGGGALLAKAILFCALGFVAARFMRRRER